MRQTCLNTIYELAKEDPRVYFVGSDLGVGTLDAFRDEMPERFLMEGVSEAHIIGLAAGLALEGKIPYVHTIATFLTRRCYEQIVLDVGLHHANVRLVAAGGGLVYAPLGPTHLATDDIAIMRAVPNMTIVAPADAEEMRAATRLSVDHDGPIYIRMAKGGDPIVTTSAAPFQIGKARRMRDGRDALAITTGVALQIALDAAASLAAEGIQLGVLHMPTVKPLDREAILNAVVGVPMVVTIEEHTLVGGLGSAVAELLIDAGAVPPRFSRIGIPDVFPEGYGSQASLMARYGITAAAVTQTVQRSLQQR